MACCHIAHDCIIKDNVIGYTTGIAGHVEIDDYAILQRNRRSSVLQDRKGVMIGAGSMVGMDIIPYVTAQGDRATLAGLNIIGLKENRLNFQK